MTSYLLLPLIQALFCLVLAAIVLKGHFRSFTHRLFSLFLTGLAIWGIVVFGMRASPDIEHAYYWERWLIPLGIFMAVIFYHFSVRYTVTSIKRQILPILYLACFLFIPSAMTRLFISGMQIKPYGYAPIHTPLGIIWMVLAGGVGIMALYNFIRAYRTSLYAEERNRIAYIIVGIAFIIIGGVFDVLPLLGLPSYPGLIIGTIFFCLLTTVAIVRHNLLDIRIVLRISIVYVLTSALVAIPFVGGFLIFAPLVEVTVFPLWARLLLLIAMAFTLPLLWRWVQKRVDRWFYRDRYDYLKALETFSQETSSVTDSSKLGATMVNLLTGALRVSSVYILQPLPHSGDFIIAFSSDSYPSNSHVILKRESLLVKWLERPREILSYEDIEIIPQLQGITFKEKNYLQQLQTKYITGLKTPMGQLSGLLVLGPKLSGQPYTIEDKELIHTICNQISTNLENVRLYAESQREVAIRKKAEEELRQSRERLRNLSAHIESMREAERTSIAREVHDELGQSLTALKMDLAWLHKRLPEKPEALNKKANEMAELITTTIQTVKRISTELRPGVLDDLGLIAAIEWQTQEFRERTQIPCEFITESEDIDLSRDISTTVFRILQEALTNITRHANATRVEVILRKGDGQLMLQVRDNGKGITEEQITDTNSFGIIGMRERARLVNGSITIKGISGKGTIVTVNIPITGRGERSDKNISRR